MAIYFEKSNKTFFVYGGTTNATDKHLLCMIGSYDHETKKLSTPSLVYDKLGVDDPHDNPSLSIDGEGYLWIFVSGRGDRRPGFKFRSNKPYDIVSGFSKISSKEMAYPQPWYIKNEGFIHLFTKYTGRRELYFETSTDGLTWSKDKKLAGIKGPDDKLGGHYQISSTKGDKIMTFFNRHIEGNADERTDLYYLQSSDFGESWQTADGKTRNIPLVKVDEARLIDYYKNKQYVYLKDMSVDVDGNPICLYIVSNSHEPGPAHGSRRWKVTHWTGKDWKTYDVTESDHNYDMGSLYVEGNIWKIIAPTAPGPQKMQAGGEIEIYTSTDKGTSWRKENELTHNSRFNHNYIRKPENAHDDFKAFWADGDPTRFSQSRLYFLSKNNSVIQMPYH